MVTTVASLSKPRRVVVGVLCWLLPAGFRERQRAEWTGDLMVMSGAGARWRYLFAAAWTLPSLRAHARRAGLDRPQAMVPPAVPVSMLARSIIFGLGGAVVCWLIAIPLRWYLLDVPAILATPGRSVPFDPKDLWPTEGPFVVLWPLWIVLMVGAWAFVSNAVLGFWLGLSTVVAGLSKRGAPLYARLPTAALGAILAALAFGYFTLSIDLSGDLIGLVPAVLGAGAILFGLTAPRLPRRTRVAIVLSGLGAVGIYASYLTPLGQAMLQWHLD